MQKVKGKKGKKTSLSPKTLNKGYIRPSNPLTPYFPDTSLIEHL
jgi:hypothetical protein